MGRCHATTVLSMTPEQIADLRRLVDDPYHALPPMRRKLLLRLRLIAPCKSLPTPSERRRARPPKRLYVLTELGRQAVQR